LIKITNKITLGMARMKHIKKDVLASMPAHLPHLPGVAKYIGIHDYKFFKSEFLEYLLEVSCF
jgi:hypothetical protein